MAEFIPYEPKLKKLNRSYYIEISIIKKGYFVVSYTDNLDDGIVSLFPKSKYTLHQAIEEFEDRWIQIQNHNFDTDGYSLDELKEKKQFLDDYYPFENTPDLLDKITCIHCDKSYTVIFYRTDSENRILCPDPDCDGTVADWIK